MQVKVLLFAMLKEALGESLTLDVPTHTTAQGLVEHFTAQYPQFKPLSASIRVALDRNYAQSDEPIKTAQEIAFIPPVSGG